jgi:hypothetical protein
VHSSDARVAHDPADIASELLAHLRGHGVPDATVTRIVPGIEDAFMELMGQPSVAA